MHSIRQWWHAITHRQQKNTLIISFFAIGLVGMGWGIFQYIDYARVRSQESASLAYTAILQLAQGQVDNKTMHPDLTHKAEHLIQHYPKTVYADMTRLLLANQAYQNSHLPAAKAYLKAVVQDKRGALVHIARLRLARLLTNERSYTEALETLDVAKKGEFEPLYYSVTGDIYAEMNELTKANEAYLQAIQTLPEGASDPWLKTKQADIGGEG